jgi:hypothetical protein
MLTARLTRWNLYDSSRQSGRSSGVEHNLAKVGVEGSNPFARSKFFHSLAMYRSASSAADHRAFREAIGETRQATIIGAVIGGVARQLHRQAAVGFAERVIGHARK